MNRAAAFVLLCIIVIVWMPTAHGVELTPKQVSVFNLAVDAGEPWRDGRLLAAIVWSESSFCVHTRGIDPTAKGCAQLHPQTADQVAGRKVSAWKLAHDERLNLHLAAEYLRDCMNRFGYRGGITCFHIGIPAAQALSKLVLHHNPYLRAVLRRVRALKHLPVDQE